MSWTLPVPSLLFAGAVAVWPLASVVRRPTSAPRLIGEAFATTLAVIGAFWLYRSGSNAGAVAIRTFPKTQTRPRAGSVRVEFRSLGWLRENAS